MRAPEEENLFTPEEGIKDKASIREHIPWDRVGLLHATGIRLVSFAHLGIADIVIRAVWPTVRVFGPEVRRRWVRKIIINCGRRNTT